MVEHVTIDESVEGDRVIDTEGLRVGVVCNVRGGVPYVHPSAEPFTSRPGRRGVGAGARPLPDAAIERITNDEVHLSENL